MKQYIKPAVIAIAAVIGLNVIASFFAPVKSALNAIPGNQNTWG